MALDPGEDAITNTADYIDSRDILARIEHLERRQGELDGDEVAELKALTELMHEAFITPEQASDGVTFIRESYFVTSAMELADDLHADANLFGTRPTSWPFMHVDWDEAADDLRQDYAEAEFDGVTYLFR